MSLGSSSPKTLLDKHCNNIVKAEDQSCNVTDDNLGSDCYESMHAFKKIRTSTSGLRKSPNKWTKEENQKLASLVSSYGEKKWKRISAEMGGQKTGAQCAQHWKRVLSPEIRKGHWDENEEELLLRLVVQYGSCWKKIAKKIPQRTDIQCRYQYLKAKQSREVMWDAKEDESLIKKVMEMANCNFFQTLDNKTSPISNSNTTPSLPSPLSLSPSPLSPLSSTSDSSPLSSSPPYNLKSNMNNNGNNSPLFVSSPRPRGNSFNLYNHMTTNNTLSPMQTSPTMSRPIPVMSRERQREREMFENDTNSSGLSSSSGSESSSFEKENNNLNRMKISGEFFEKERDRMRMSGEILNNKSDSIWNDDKHNVSMTDSPNWRNNLKDDRLCTNCRSPFVNHINKVVWLEISEHMARLKLTSTLRTALECKTRFTELLGNKMPFGAPSPSPFVFPNIPSSSPETNNNTNTNINNNLNNNLSNNLSNNSTNNLNNNKNTSGLKTSGDLGRNGFTLPHPLGGSGGIRMDRNIINEEIGSRNVNNNVNSNNSGIKGFPSNLNDNIGVKINSNNMNVNNNNNKPVPNNINLTNCNNNNITINITNSYTTNNLAQNGNNYQQITHSPLSSSPLSSSSSSPNSLGRDLLSKANTILSPAPPFPSFSIPSFPHLPPPPSLSSPLPKPGAPRGNVSGLESLAAVASILPREMLADYF